MILPANRAAWPLKLREEFEERAAIVEYLACYSRQEAERLAELDIRKQYGEEVQDGLELKF